MSQANETNCPPGYRDDTMFLYHDFPSCTQSETANQVLFIIWTIFFVACLLEHTPRFYRFLLGERKNWAQSVLYVLYVVWTGSLLIFCIYVDARNFQISVGDNISDGAVLWTLLGIANSSVIVGLTIMLLMFSRMALAVIENHQNHLRMTQVCLILAVLICIACLLLPFLPQLLTDPVAREDSINSFCIIYGVLATTEAVLGVIYFNFIKSIASTQLKFHLSLSTPDSTTVRSLRELVMRMRLLTLVTSADILTPIFYILIGAVIRFQYAVIHVIIGFTCPPIVIIYLLYVKSPVLQFVWRNRHVAAFIGHASSQSATSQIESSKNHRDSATQLPLQVLPNGPSELIARASMDLLMDTPHEQV